MAWPTIMHHIIFDIYIPHCPSCTSALYFTVVMFSISSFISTSWFIVFRSDLHSISFPLFRPLVEIAAYYLKIRQTDESCMTLPRRLHWSPPRSVPKHPICLLRWAFPPLFLHFPFQTDWLNSGQGGVMWCTLTEIPSALLLLRRLLTDPG